MMERSVAVQEVKFMRLDTDLIRFVAAVSIVLGHCFLMYLDLALGITSFCVDIGMRIL